MKILKNSLIILLFTFFGCSSDQSNLDIIIEEQNNSIYQTNSVATYSLEEVLNGMRKWDSLRINRDALLYYFESNNAFNLDMSQFPQGSALHAYACILNGELKFAVISEIYDKEIYQDSLINHIKIVDLHYADIVELTEQTYESYTFPLPTQYIQAADAINRIKDWNTNYANWLKETILIYQGFHMPTYSLTAQNYTVYFGLKNNIENPAVKAADLVFDNNNGLFYDSMRAYPPLVDETKRYFVLELI
ncbi:hypothetical protein [Paenimyroides viscosum]|uniref:Uncharacterized protein n=1 Tax=Paenimyroides viscosum TaxID=2488729 RepID=A0A3P1B340_9FLAO|nr:hypothetical protein [Paenimyroides viscosum]RRA95428.1 hypothetical protein EG242_06110 [Paenimyroides viscosum]